MHNGPLAGAAVAFIGGGVVYGAIKVTMGLRLSEEAEYTGADLAVHRITAQPD